MKYFKIVITTLITLGAQISASNAQGFGGANGNEEGNNPPIEAPGSGPSEMFGACESQEDYLISGLQNLFSLNYGSNEIQVAGWKWLDDAAKYLGECLGIVKSIESISKDLAKGICRKTALCNPESYHCIQALSDALLQCTLNQPEKLRPETKQANCLKIITEKLENHEFSHCL